MIVHNRDVCQRKSGYASTSGYTKVSSNLFSNTCKTEFHLQHGICWLPEDRMFPGKCHVYGHSPAEWVPSTVVDGSLLKSYARKFHAVQNRKGSRIKSQLNNQKETRDTFKGSILNSQLNRKKETHDTFQLCRWNYQLNIQNEAPDICQEFACFVCEERFGSKEDFSEHYNTSHSGLEWLCRTK